MCYLHISLKIKVLHAFREVLSSNSTPGFSYAWVDGHTWIESGAITGAAQLKNNTGKDDFYCIVVIMIQYYGI